jgi:hypothetical protein
MRTGKGGGGRDVGKVRSGVSLLDRESSHMTLPLLLRNFHLLPYAHRSTQHHSKCLIALVILPYCRFPTKCARGWSVTQVCECDGVRGKAALPKLRDMGVRGGEIVILS